jgi:hypothetical protein
MPTKFGFAAKVIGSGAAAAVGIGLFGLLCRDGELRSN